jgi:hypothetical protein
MGCRGGTPGWGLRPQTLLYLISVKYAVYILEGFLGLG